MDGSFLRLSVRDLLEDRKVGVVGCVRGTCLSLLCDIIIYNDSRNRAVRVGGYLTPS
jgi:hypothetical protein